jgi:CubicO group peptidase (beta-lactamase class C family)
MLETSLDAPLDTLASSILLQPNDIGELSFLRRESGCDPAALSVGLVDAQLEFAATELCPWRKRLIEGEVHDENAYCMAGVCGHAGLFGTARGVFSLLSTLRKVYRGDIGSGLMSPGVLRCFWTRQGPVPESTWALGFDTPNIEGSSAGSRFSRKSVGHLGFTGTSFWFDPERDVLVILLTNRVYPTRNNDRMKAFRPLVHNLVMEAIDDLS